MFMRVQKYYGDGGWGRKVSVCLSVFLWNEIRKEKNKTSLLRWCLACLPVPGTTDKITSPRKKAWRRLGSHKLRVETSS